MPGVIMDNVNIDGSVRRLGLDGARNGASNSLGDLDKAAQVSGSLNGSVYVNGSSGAVDTWNQTSTTPFELTHITQGFFPFGILVNRSVQQCWNELSELITELAAIQVPHQAPLSTTNGKGPGNQSSENVHKKLRLLDFAHAKRAEFIKLLVLSQWSRQAADVSRLIDIQGFIRTRHQSYDAALQYVGEVKRDLVRAQVANPDLKTALLVLSKGQVASLPDLGYSPLKTLTARATLKKLLKLNRIISVRLTLHDSVPHALRHYRVHDGRVTFTVPGEFELDLSVAEISTSSQFFFVDIRFLFSPSSPIPEGRILNELDAKINEILRNDGLMGCFNFLHGLVLTNKINIMFRQATDLARGLWSDALRIELLHRTLVIQYWPQRAGPKSWLEIGVNSGHRGSKSSNPISRTSHLGLRWMRDGQSAITDAIKFDTDDLSMERILRSVVALHTSHILFTAFTTLKRHLLFAKHTLSLQAQLSSTEPGDCHLNVQLTASRSVRVSIEPMSGFIILCVTPNVPERLDTDRTIHKSSIEEILSRVSRLRCTTAVDEIESGTKALGLETVSQRVLGLDPRKLFPLGVMRSVFFVHQLWNRQWVAAATSSMDGDRWWLVQLRPNGTAKVSPPYNVGENGITLPRAHVISENFVPTQERLDYTTCAELVHALTGILAIHANACYLAELPGLRFLPPLRELQMQSDLTVPDLLISYNPSTLPTALRIALPSGVNRQSQFKEMVRLAFHGIDSNSRSIIVVAHGTFKNRIKSLVPLISKTDPVLITEDKGAGFALRLVVPAGHSVIVGLFERLQRLECVLSILQSLIQNGMEPRSLSLSQIAFAYGKEAKSLASFDIGVSGPILTDFVDMAALSKSQPLFHLQLGIKFERSSPHRRIQEALAVALNHRFTETGVGSILYLMSFTLPLLQSFDHITNSPNQTDSPMAYITVRGPTEYQIHYPRLNSRFRLNTIKHQDEVVWILRDANRDNQSGRDQIASAIRERLYQSKGHGWNGLGDGAVGVPDKVGNLLTELHQCLSAPHLELDKEAEEKAVVPGLLPTKVQIPGLQKNPVSNQASGLGNTDVITID
ncbi:uncharacterized protein N7511_006531 [Penicillium nucicola]|uniref:uncharacterized protein n=1 Tax=Penicillium nucicola TaxID=1850975 RepID=UPI00254573F5|nr:uncharacterized protein N7511_006531 [Penicillium nucicola]KAJ5757837.1 hypothetical protein N7511_006531 [Penicillium nucicola]